MLITYISLKDVKSLHVYMKGILWTRNDLTRYITSQHIVSIHWMQSNEIINNVKQLIGIRLHSYPFIKYICKYTTQCI